MARPLRTLPQLPGRHGVFTAAEGYADGWTHSALKAACRAGRIIRLQRGVYAEPGSQPERWDRTRAGARQQAVAAVLAVPGSVASHCSAAVLAGLPVWDVPPHACHTIAPRRRYGDSCAAHLHRAALPLGSVYDADVPRTRIARTVIDIAREHHVVDAVVAGDAALRQRRTDRHALDRVLLDCAGWPGLRRARAGVDLLDPRSESPLESASRVALWRLDVAPPEPQVEIARASGHIVARVDLFWEQFGVVGEVDGRDKYRSDPTRSFDDQRERQARLEDLGLIVVRWGIGDVLHPERLAEKVRLAFARAAVRPQSDRAWHALSTAAW